MQRADNVEQTHNEDRHTLVISCPDDRGLVAAVAACVARHGGTLTEANNHTDTQQRWFFMRNVIAGAPRFNADAFTGAFTELAKLHDMHWTLSEDSRSQRVVILAKPGIPLPRRSSLSLEKRRTALQHTLRDLQS